jgi:hypothetical protein
MANKLKTEEITTDQIGQHVSELYRFVSTERKSFERRWYDNNFFDDGFHYRSLQRSTGKIIDLSDKSTLYSPMRAIPKASRQIRGVANLLVSNDPTPVIFPEKVPMGANIPPEVYEQAVAYVKEEAKRRGYWLEQEFKKQEIAEKLALMCILSAKHGVSWFQIWPDSVEEQIKTQVYDAFDVMVFGTLNDPEDSPFMGKAIPKLISQIKADEKFDKEALDKISPDNKRSGSEIKEAYMNTRFGKESNPDNSTTLILKECYIKEYLNGTNLQRLKLQDDGEKIVKGKELGDMVMRQVFVAGNITLRDRYVNLTKYPFVDFRYEPGAIYQVPMIERFIPQNKSLDAAVSRIERFMHTMNIGVYQKRSGEQFKVSNASGGQVIEYEQTPLQQMNLAPMPAYVFNFLTYLGSLIDEQGVSLSTLNKIPAGVKAASAIESLKESEYSNLVIAQRRLKRTLKTIAERMLEIADEYFVTPKDVEYQDGGKPKSFSVIGNEALKGRKKLKVETPNDVVTIKRDLKVEVEIQSGSAFTREGKRELSKQIVDTLAEFYKLGIVPPESVKVAFEKWLDDYGFGATAEFMDAWSKGTKDGTLTTANIDQIKVGVMEVMNDLVKGGVLPTPEQRMQETKVANMEALRDVQKAGGTGGQPNGEEKEPSKSISFKDLPPEGKVQLAQQAGIQIQPASMAAYEISNKPVPKENKNVGTK